MQVAATMKEKNVSRFHIFFTTSRKKYSKTPTGWGGCLYKYINE